MARVQGSGISRRGLFSLGGAAAAAAGAAGEARAADPAPTPAGETQQVIATQGTNIAPSASPDGRQIAFDLYGVLWLIPVGGGPARRMTEDVFEIAQPDWFPDGRRLVFQSYRDGGFHIWSIGADGTGLRQLTSGPFDDREPRVSPDGKRIAFSSDRGGRYGVHVLDLASGDITAVDAGPGDVCEPAWSPDGRMLAVAIDKARIAIVPLGGGAARVIAEASAATERLAAGALYSPAFTPGQGVIYTAVENGKAELRTAGAGALVAGEDVFPFRVSWLPGGDFLYAADGHIRRRTPGSGATSEIGFSVVAPVTRPSYRRRVRDFTAQTPRPVIGIGAPALSPDGRRVAFRALNDIYLLRIGERARPLIQDGFHKLDPAWSPDGRQLVYASDRGGKLDLWIRDLASGQDRLLTHGFADAAVSPAWSRDGRRIAFLTQNGGLHVADVATGEVRKLYDDLWEPGKPSWGPGDRAILMAAFKPYSARFREGLSEILAVDVATGVGRYAPVRPHRSLGTRGDDGPVWSPDGKRVAFVFASRLHVADIAPDGALTSAPKPINDEVSDAPTWSGDGAQILYLSAGRLRLIPSAGGSARTLEHGLTWTQVRAKGRLVVAAGRLWDGTTADYRHAALIVVEDDRIAAVLPAGDGPTDVNARRIDASKQTVIPGLVDMHTHRQMQGYGYGGRDGRLWLSLGVTTTRSPGGPAYHTVEDQEAIEAGARLGPRYFATGEAIDGSRIYYNFMRPVTEPGQMALELRRAEALGYDLIKTYVRLAPDRQAEVIAWAHARGLPVTSHYHYPALAFGGDGMEHMGATARTGYSRTLSLLGGVYQDVTAAFAASHAPRTPTLFLAQALFPDDRSLIEDRRVRTLYPPWEYARLVARADQLAKQDRTAQLEALARQVAGARDVLRAGGRIVTGTDSPIDYNAVSLHMNLRAMVRYGLTPCEALGTATRASGEFLGQPLGVVRAGAFADLTIVNGDPLARIEDAAAVTTVVRAGVPHTVDELLGPYPTQPLAAEAAAPRRFVCESPPQFWWHHPAWLEAARATCCDGACGSGFPI
jgi:Tol biopolymer transport system component/imidazolonepropionase-like amidohydrolase